MTKPGKPVARALKVWIALLLLLGITVGCSYIPLGAGNSLINALAALGKAGLVIAFFMHMRDSTPVIRLVAIFGAVTLSLLFLLSGLDFITRATGDAPWQSTPPSLYTEPAN